MIELPRRSVTRFFVPLIDVLILLFCIFLLLPFVSRPEAEKTEGDPEKLPTEVTTLQTELANARELNKELARKATNTAKTIKVQVIEIDADNGKLFYLNKDGKSTKREPIANEAAAKEIINNSKDVLPAGQEIHFLILHPRKKTGFPLSDDLKEYRRWFAGEPHSFDDPWSAGK